jgi:hypothetical protein
MNDYFKSMDGLSRRAFVSHAAHAFLGLGLMPLGQLLAAPARSSSRGEKNTGVKNVIYLYMGGGMSHMDTFDPKPGTDNAGPVEAIATSADGVRISQYLPNLAGQMDKVAVINSLTSNQGAHSQANYLMHTSYVTRGTIKHPGLGAWMLKLQGAANDTIPGYVAVGGMPAGGNGFLEAKYSPLVVGNPEAGLQNSKRPEGLSDDQFVHRLKLAERLDRNFRKRYNQKAVRAYDQMYDDALTLMKSKDIRAFDIKREKTRTREMYGMNSFGQGCLLARRLVENNVRYVEVSLGGWDTHIENFNAVEQRCNTLDKALAGLLKDLSDRGLLDTTVVVLATEFGRTPRINQNNGRDHYPRAFSGLLAGGGIKAGQVWGKTNETGEQVAENPVNIPDFNATIAKAVGLPLDKIIYSPSKRPFTVAHKGKPVDQLVS